MSRSEGGIASLSFSGPWGNLEIDLEGRAA